MSGMPSRVYRDAEGDPHCQVSQIFVFLLALAPILQVFHLEFHLCTLPYFHRPFHRLGLLSNPQWSVTTLPFLRTKSPCHRQPSPYNCAKVTAMTMMIAKATLSVMNATNTKLYLDAREGLIRHQKQTSALTPMLPTLQWLLRPARTLLRYPLRALLVLRANSLPFQLLSLYTNQSRLHPLFHCLFVMAIATRMMIVKRGCVVFNGIKMRKFLVVRVEQWIQV